MLQTQRRVWKCTKNALPVWLKFCAKAVRVATRISTLQETSNVELGLMCTDENDEEEMTKLYAHLYENDEDDKDPGGFFFFFFFKNWWYGIRKEFDCNVSSTWSLCGKVSAEAFTHRHLGKDRKEELSQLDYIIGPMRRNDEVYIHNERSLWATWDHYLIVREDTWKATRQSLSEKE